MKAVFFLFFFCISCASTADETRMNPIICKKYGEVERITVSVMKVPVSINVKNKTKKQTNQYMVKQSDAVKNVYVEFFFREDAEKMLKLLERQDVYSVNVSVLAYEGISSSGLPKGSALFKELAMKPFPQLNDFNIKHTIVILDLK